MKTKNIVICCFIFILIILIIIFIIFKNVCYYRLGDMIKSNTLRSKLKGECCHKIFFKDSIATEYMSKTSKEEELDILSEIIRKKSSQKLLPNRDELIIHLRIGDVIDKVNISVDDFVKDYQQKRGKGVPNIQYVKPYIYYDNIIKKLPKNINNVVLIGGYHRTGNHSKSIDYVNKIKLFFENRGFNVNTRINNDPDEDFIYMSNSYHFVQSGGGFSNIINKILEKQSRITY
jgi:hypothetical protein